LQSGGGCSPAGKSYHGHGNDHRNCGVWIAYSQTTQEQKPNENI
jgi:hypothetical protein